MPGGFEEIAALSLVSEDSEGWRSKAYRVGIVIFIDFFGVHHSARCPSVRLPNLNSGDGHDALLD